MGEKLKKISLFVLGMIMPGMALADDASLTLAVRRIGLEWSKTQVRHAAEYEESPVSALKADSQDFVKGVFDTALEYNKGRFQWDNGLFMEYGETKLKPYDEPETVSENALPAQMVESLDAYIRENCSEEISNTEIGAIFGYHPFYVSNKLKECRGTTLRQYIINYRMKLAKRLLELTDKSVGEIAEEAGFNDASYFTKSFKASFGMTPKDYRNEFKDRFI